MSENSRRDQVHLVNLALVRLTGASLKQIQAEYFDVLREFFNDSSWWTETFPLAIVADTTDYNVEPSGGQIIRLSTVVDANLFPQPAIMPEIGVIRFMVPYSQAQTFSA